MHKVLRSNRTFFKKRHWFTPAIFDPEKNEGLIQLHLENIRYTLSMQQRAKKKKSDMMLNFGTSDFYKTKKRLLKITKTKRS